jgi:hypothetical protein
VPDLSNLDVNLFADENTKITVPAKQILKIYDYNLMKRPASNTKIEIR